MHEVIEGFYKGKTVLVTGNTGFKGSWISLWLRHLRANVVGYALKPPTNPSLFELCRLKEKVTGIYGDIKDLDNLQTVINTYQPEIVFHLAAQSLVRRSYQEPVETYATNVMGTVNVLEAVRNSKCVKAVVIVTTDKCYENQEWVWGYREIDSLGGNDPYSSSKGCAELVTGAYVKSYFNPDRYKEHGVAVASVRAGNVIGGGDWAADRLIPDCIQAMIARRPVIIRSPNAIRPWQHVLEPLYGYLLLGKKLYEDGPDFIGAWNFGPAADDARPVKWIVEYLTRHWDEEAAWLLDEGYNPDEANYLRLDCSKARNDLGWQPKWSLESALLNTLNWYRAYVKQDNLLNVTMQQIYDYENM